MPTHVGLLYSIVLAPGRRAVMTELKRATEAAGYRNVETLLATGNLVFDADEPDVLAIGSALEAAFQRQFGKAVDIIVRDAAAFRALAASNPFPAETAEHGSRVIVRIMRNAAPAETGTRLADLRKPRRAHRHRRGRHMGRISGAAERVAPALGHLVEKARHRHVAQLEYRPPDSGKAVRAPSTSSVMILKRVSVLGPKVWVIGTSAASRPKAIGIRPLRRALLRGSKTCHCPER
jgi:uncharacterized protein (DUF1697 family)